MEGDLKPLRLYQIIPSTAFTAYINGLEGLFFVPFQPKKHTPHADLEVICFEVVLLNSLTSPYGPSRYGLPFGSILTFRGDVHVEDFRGPFNVAIDITTSKLAITQVDIKREPPPPPPMRGIRLREDK